MSLLFAFNLNVVQASSAAYYYANLNQGSIAEGGAVSFYPTQTASTYVSIQASFATQAPAGSMVAGLIVSPENESISGSIGVSPAVNVPVVASLYGVNGPIASVTIPAGETSANFNWSVKGQHGLQAEDVKTFTKQAPQP